MPGLIDAIINSFKRDPSSSDLPIEDLIAMDRLYGSVPVNTGFGMIMNSLGLPREKIASLISRTPIPSDYPEIEPQRYGETAGRMVSDFLPYVTTGRNAVIGMMTPRQMMTRYGRNMRQIQTEIDNMLRNVSPKTRASIENFLKQNPSELERRISEMKLLLEQGNL